MKDLKFGQEEIILNEAKHLIRSIKGLQDDVKT